MTPPPPSDRAGKTLKSQYQDLCDDESEEGELVQDTINPVCDDLPSLNTSVGEEPMDATASEVIEGSWFPPNPQSNPKRNRGDVLNHSGSDIEDHLAQPKKKKQDRSALPVNKTLLSNGVGTTVVIAQDLQDRDSLIGANSKKFTQDPMNLSRSLKDLLDYTQVKDVRVNKRRNVVGIEFHENNADALTALLTISSVGPFAVRCYRPAADLGEVSWGVIGAIHEDVDIQDLLSSIKCDGFEVIHVSRLHKFVNGKKEMSRAVKIGFSGKRLPQSLTIDFFHYNVRPFEQPPLRCFRCQRPGHLANGCSAKPRCLVCGGPHSKDECSSASPRCANCLGAHVASSRDCRFNREALQVQSLVREGMSFAGARRQVLAGSQSSSVSRGTGRDSVSGTQALLSQDAPSVIGSAPVPSQLEHHEVPVDFHQTQGSYIIPRRYPRHPSNYAAALSPSPSVAAASAHPPVDTILKQCEDAISKSMTSLFAKLSAFLVEMFSMNVFEEGKSQRQMLLIGMVRNHFGSAISDPLLKQHRDQQLLLKQRQKEAGPAAGAPSTAPSAPEATSGKTTPVVKPSKPGSTGAAASNRPSSSSSGVGTRGKGKTGSANVRTSTRKK